MLDEYLRDPPINDGYFRADPLAWYRARLAERFFLPFIAPTFPLEIPARAEPAFTAHFVYHLAPKLWDIIEQNHYGPDPIQQALQPDSGDDDPYANLADKLSQAERDLLQRLHQLNSYRRTPTAPEELLALAYEAIASKDLPYCYRVRQWKDGKMPYRFEDLLGLGDLVIPGYIRRCAALRSPKDYSTVVSCLLLADGHSIAYLAPVLFARWEEQTVSEEATLPAQNWRFLDEAAELAKRNQLEENNYRVRALSEQFIQACWAGPAVAEFAAYYKQTRGKAILGLGATVELYRGLTVLVEQDPDYPVLVSDMRRYLLHTLKQAAEPQKDDQVDKLWRNMRSKTGRRP